MEAWVPGESQGAYQSRASLTRSAHNWMMKMVEPYIIIMSPGFRVPTLTASAAASIVPVVTGVPSARPVSFAARAWILPAISADQANSGRRSSGTMPSVSSVVPVLAGYVVERAEVGCRVVVDHVVSGQPKHDVGC